MHEHGDYLDACRLLSASEIALLLRMDPAWELPRTGPWRQRMEAGRVMRRRLEEMDEGPPEGGGLSCDDGVPVRPAVDIELEERAVKARRMAEVARLVNERSRPMETDGNLALADPPFAPSEPTPKPRAGRVTRAVRHIPTGTDYPGGVNEAANKAGVTVGSIYAAISNHKHGRPSSWCYSDALEPAAAAPVNVRRAASVASDRDTAEVAAEPVPDDSLLLAKVMLCLGRGGAAVDFNAVLPAIGKLQQAARLLKLIESGGPLIVRDGELQPARVLEEPLSDLGTPENRKNVSAVRGGGDGGSASGFSGFPLRLSN